MPKRPSSKRKAATSDEEDASTKKQKISEPSSSASSTDAQPTNKVLPANISFPPRAENTTRIVSWNVCGFAASQKKGFKSYVEAEDPDILVLTETKVHLAIRNFEIDADLTQLNQEPVDPALSQRFPHSYWSVAEKKGYSGTAILSKHKALSVTKTLPGHPDSSIVKGRIITLEFESHYLIATYVPNAGEKLKTLDVKKEWNLHFETYIRSLKKPVIWTGDLNVAPTALDLKNPKPNWNKTAGYTEAETTAFKSILDGSDETNKFVDIWRQLHPTTQHFTYYSYRFNCREKGTGWRLDMFVLSESIVNRVKMCEIRSEIYGASDHLPLVLEIEGPL